RKRYRKFTHIEGSCQETKLPLPQLLTTFSRCALLGELHPRLVASDASLFSCTWCRPFWRRTIHPSGSRPQDVSPPRPDVGPWHVACPIKPSVPCRVSLDQADKCSGSLLGPVSIWLTAQASPDSTNKWVGQLSWGEARTKQSYGYEPYVLPVSPPTPTG